jgi:hypothetical protein
MLHIIMAVMSLSYSGGMGCFGSRSLGSTKLSLLLTFLSLVLLILLFMVVLVVTITFKFLHRASEFFAFLTEFDGRHSNISYD